MYFPNKVSNHFTSAMASMSLWLGVTLICWRAGNNHISDHVHGGSLFAPKESVDILPRFNLISILLISWVIPRKRKSNDFLYHQTCFLLLMKVKYKRSTPHLQCCYLNVRLLMKQMLGITLICWRGNKHISDHVCTAEVFLHLRKVRKCGHSAEILTDSIQLDVCKLFTVCFFCAAFFMFLN